MSANGEEQAARPVATLKNPAKRIKYTEQSFPQAAATDTTSVSQSSENIAPFVTRVTASGPPLPEKDEDTRSPEASTTAQTAATSATLEASTADASSGDVPIQEPASDAPASASAASAEEQDGKASVESANVSAESDGR